MIFKILCIQSMKAKHLVTEETRVLECKLSVFKKNVALQNSYLLNALRLQKQISAEKSKRCPRVVYSLWRFCNNKNSNLIF